MIMLLHPLIDALAFRKGLLEKLHSEDTFAYRLFHGINEGAPGLTIDRYGELILIQTFHQSLSESELATIQQFYTEQLPYSHFFVYNDRSSPNSRYQNRLIDDVREDANSERVFQELGVNYSAKGRHKGQDPHLFLDFRAARRFVLENSAQKSVLNLFAYTCGMGVAAAAGGANRVVNVDFARSSLDVGEENARLNGLGEPTIEFIHSDFFTAARQMAGLPVSARRGRVSKLPKYHKLEQQRFDLVVLDPPKWAKSPFGTVDLVRDYSSVFKPALLCTKEGGQMLCANNVAQVPLKEWIDTLQRSAKKAGQPIRSLQIIEPEADFPSRDGQFPLKVAVLDV